MTTSVILVIVLSLSTVMKNSSVTVYYNIFHMFKIHFSTFFENMKKKKFLGTLPNKDLYIKKRSNSIV